MKGFTLLLSILLIVLGALTIGSNHYIARADTSAEQFIVAARENGYIQPEDELLRNGYIICASAAQDGVNDDLIGRGIRAAQRFLGQDVNEQRDELFVSLAQKHLCPEEVNQP